MAVIDEILLASQSKFRKELLASTGLTFECVKPDVDEESIQNDDPDLLALERAVAKAKQVAEINPESLVIGCDQVLSLDGKSFGKVDSKEDAMERLRHLSGKTHFLLSAFALGYSRVAGTKPEVLHQEIVKVPMNMREINEREIENYFATSYEWQNVVGCYRFESYGVNFFDNAGGDSSAIIGLPLVPLLKSLRAIGVSPLESPKGPWQILVR